MLSVFRRRERRAVTVQAPQTPSLGFRTGDHVCAFYNGHGNSLDEIIVDYLSDGLRAQDRCFCMVDAPSSVRDRIPPELVSRDGILDVLTEDEAYMPDGSFSSGAFIDNMETMIRKAFASGYQRFRAVGDETFLIRNGVDLNEWFAAEERLNEIVPDYPHFFFCLYDLDLFDGDTVMHVFKTHPRVYLNGMVIANPYYLSAG
jgi:hypothetical protein